MKQNKCHTCDKVTHNLSTANCGHKICFNCVKINRNTRKCSSCAMSNSKNKLQGLSPIQKRLLQKERDKTSKTKSIQGHRHQQSSPLVGRSSRYSQIHIQSCSNYLQGSTHEEQRMEIRLLCKQHQEPLTLFSISSKQAICSMCLCSKPKYKEQIMPIKNAEDFLKKQNRQQREQSRLLLNEIQKRYKIMKVNYQQFNNFYEHHSKIVAEIFMNLHHQLDSKEKEINQKIDEFFSIKLKQCQEVQQDLSYLKQTLQTYRQQNKETNTLTESLYVYSSFKLIKKTMKTLNLDYINYANKNVNLLQYNKSKFDESLQFLIKFQEELPLKHQEEQQSQRRKRGHSTSISRLKNFGYSQKKSSIYENLLNQRISFKQGQDRSSICKNLESVQKQKQNVYNQPKKFYASKSHTNSLSSYIHQNLEKQQPQNNNTSNFNQSSGQKYSQNSISSNSAFDYELKTPLKQQLTDCKVHLSNSKPLLQDQTSNKTPEKKFQQINVLSASTISGFEMTQQEKSLYKRLLKAKISKNSQNQQLEQGILASDYKKVQQEDL